VGAIEAKFYEELLHGLGINGSEMPVQFERESWPATKEIFAAKFREKTRDEWTEIFEGVDACVTPVLTPREALVTATTRLATCSRSTATFNPSRRRDSPRRRVRSGDPRERPLGTREGLLRWGVDPTHLEALRAEGAFG